MKLSLKERQEDTIIRECIDVNESKARPNFVEYCNNECVLPVGCLH